MIQSKEQGMIKLKIEDNHHHYHPQNYPHPHHHFIMIIQSNGTEQKHQNKIKSERKQRWRMLDAFFRCCCCFRSIILMDYDDELMRYEDVRIVLGFFYVPNPNKTKQKRTRPVVFRPGKQELKLMIMFCERTWKC